MSIVKHVVILLLLWLPSVSAAAALPVLHHVLRVTPDIKTGELQVEDTLRIPAELRQNGQFSFMLNPQFTLNADGASQPTQATGTYSIPLKPEQGFETVTIKCI